MNEELKVKKNQVHTPEKEVESPIRKGLKSKEEIVK